MCPLDMLSQTLNEGDMRSIISVLALVLCLGVATSALAEDTWKDICEALSETAGSIMTARQSGVPLAQMMNMLTEKKPAGATEKDKRFIEGIVFQAYEQPRFDTEDDKEKAINDFQDTIYLRCAKIYR